MLVAPPWLEVYGDFRKAAQIGCVSPPLGLAYLGSAVLAVGSECKIVDMENERLTATDLISIINDYRPDMAGLTATTPVFNNAKLLAEALKKNFPDLPVGIGGVHSTIIGKPVMEECGYFDFQVVGEGETTIQEIIAGYEKDGSLEGVNGVIFRRGNKIIENRKRSLIENLDDIPIPARHLLDTKRYRHYLPGKGFVVYADVLTSRGCPFQCTFCSQHTMYGRRMRWHSIGRIIAELKEITENLGIQHIIIIDETLTLNKGRMLKLCRAIKDAGLKFTWEGWTHASAIDEEMLGAMKSAGLIRISFGIESGDPEILKSIKKGVTLEQIRNAYKITAQFGLETRGSAILGHPNETRETAWRTIKFIRSIKECQQMFLNIACPYPGTELYDCAVKGRGGMRLLTSDYSQYRRYGDPVISVNDLKPKDLKRLQSIGLLYFYLTPRRIWYNVFKRTGLKAGLVNAFAFIRSVLVSFFRTKRL